MIQQGFYQDAHRHSERLEQRIRDREAISWKHLSLGFGLSGAILLLLSLIFLLGY